MWIDTHAHLDQEEFDADRGEMIQRALDAGVEAIMTIGTTLSSSRAAVDLAASHDALFAAVGIQPNSCAEAQSGDWDQVVSLIEAPKVLALGETGLDRYWDYSPFDLQQDYFSRHLELSQRCGLPVVIHCREAEADVVQMLTEARSRGPVAGVMHSFSGDADTAAACVELGLYISFAGMVTFKKSQALREVAVAIPPERILIETDSPYLSPVPLRGKRNEPARVIHTGACLAEVRELDVGQFARQTTDNAKALFGFQAR
jgi:TatD DNase family protein